VYLRLVNRTDVFKCCIKLLVNTNLISSITFKNVFTVLMPAVLSGRSGLLCARNEIKCNFVLHCSVIYDAAAIFRVAHLLV